MSVFERNVFGQLVFVKKMLVQSVGYLTRNRYVGFNDLAISGSEIIPMLPPQGVLFVANHQTIFADVVAMFHVIFSSLNGQINHLKDASYLKRPKENVYYVAARETMEKGFLPPILAYAGAVTVDRTWRKGQEMIQRAHNPDDTKQIGKALEDGWVVTFPQGTTRQGAPVRKGTAHIIKEYDPVVVPIRVDGFRTAFDKTGLKIRKKGVTLSLNFRTPIPIDANTEEVAGIMKKIALAIEENNSEE